MIDHYTVKRFYKKGIEQISRSVRAYVYIVLTSQVQARSSIVGNSAPAVDAQKVFKSTFEELINEDYSIGIDIDRYQFDCLSFSVESKMASLLFTIGGAVVNALAFSGTNFVFSRLTDHGAKERKRHDLAEEKLQMTRDKWNEDQMKRLDFMNKRLREKQRSKGIHQ